MKTVAHLSDLHFGREVPAIADALVDELHAVRPALVVVSGDLTQRARRSQFRAARDFLARLPAPRLTVPGNHDIPLYDAFRRFARPLNRFRRFIFDDPSPFYRDDEIAVAGVNTARSLAFKGGRISIEQIAQLRARLQPLPRSLLKVVVTHHQFVPRPGQPVKNVVGRADLALEALDACGVDLLLAGHLHSGFAGDTRTHAPMRNSLVVAQCGTSISNRVRGEPNGYNVLELERDCIRISMRSWSGTGFAEAARSCFVRGDGGWVRQAA